MAKGVIYAWDASSGQYVKIPNYFAGSSGGGSGDIPPQATSSTLGGIKANGRTTETIEIVIDNTTGFLYAKDPLSLTTEEIEALLV